MRPLLARSIRTALTLIFLLPVVVCAELPFSYDTTPGRLPKTIVPRHYELRVKPDVATLKFSGSVETEIEVLEATEVVVMNALNLEIDSVRFDGAEAPFSLNRERQTLTVTLPAPAENGRHTFSATFRGTIQPQAQGLFFDKYTTDSGEKLMLGTQFEVADARQVFPCWDEPVFRATFSLTVVVPEKFLAVSNMPVIRDTVLADGWREVAFDRTPSMSTYLLALFAGEFETLEDEHDGIALRIITTEGKRDSGAYAMESTKRILSYMNDYFGVRYPLPKLDQIAVPNAFATFGAMENWGCIAYIDTLLLFDPATGSESTRQSIFSVMAHEIAHQWFGNIVTMAWWDNLWLNEGFASWMGDKATGDLHPDWNISVRSERGTTAAMTLDASSATHPVQVKIADENDAMYSFDVITYQKGQAILRMLETYIGEDAFRSGVQDYIHSHQYSNTTTADLWSAFDRSSGREVSALAAAWTDKPGFPLVSIATAADGDHLVLRQERFEVGPWSEEAPVWKIPVTLANTANPSSVQVVLLDEASVEVPLPPGDGVIKANIGGIGYYRVRYEGDLAIAVNHAAPALPVADQINLLTDTWALIEAAKTPAPVLLDLIESVRSSDDPLVWNKIIGLLESIHGLQVGEPGGNAFANWSASILGPRLELVGWEATPGEGPTVSGSRSSLISALGRFHHHPTIDECRRRFAAGPGSIPGGIRSAVLSVVGRHADRSAYEKLHEFARSARSTIDKSRGFAAMQAAEDSALATDTLTLTLSGTLPPSIQTWNVSSVADAGHTLQAWEFTQANLAALLAQIPNDSQFSLVPSVFRSFTDTRRADELLDFVRENFPAAAMPEAAKAAAAIRRRASLKAKELAAIDAWIAAR